MKTLIAKHCRKCKTTKAASKFYKNPITDDGLATYCKECSKAVSNTKEAALKKYGISTSDYEKMLEDQEGCCFICKEVETTKIKGKIRDLSVDHCHSKGHVRRLLCGRCNSGLGLFRDRPELLRAAADYLEEHDGRNQTGGPVTGETSEPKNYTQESQRQARAPSQVRITSGPGPH